ncbi:MAG: histidine kinase [Anaerolineales bacterium]|nr:histidine kinase [Anaerolineales bacterium]
MALKEERDYAQQAVVETQIVARQTAEIWTNALVGISRRIAELEHVDDILLYIVQNVRQLLHTNFIGIAILIEDSSVLELKCYSSEDKTELVANASIAVTNSLILKAMRTSCSYRSEGDESVELFEGVCFFTSQKARAIAIVPLKLKNTNIGALWIARYEEQQFSETDLIWLESMADQVAIAVQHGLMMSQLQSLSIIEERGRIAREMHDGLAQVLGYLNLQVQTLGSLLQQGKSEKLQAELTQMRQAIRVAHADVRENILSLRTTLAQDKGLVVAVGEYLTEFEIQTGVETNFSYHVEGELNLSSIAEVQLVCILQEALANVRKHAQADRVEVGITKEDHGNSGLIHLQIVDNGVGFMLAGSKRNFGLKTMRERAQSVGGNLSIKSQFGSGTQVECRLPCLHQEEIQRKSVVIQ